MERAVVKRIIVNADDFGISAGVNHAVIAAVDAGCVSSATLLVNGDAASEAARLALMRPQLGVGLHFTLTFGAPLAPARPRILTGSDGLFLSRSRIARNALLGRIRDRDITAELAAQFDRLVRFGISPTHVDTHQHVHAVPIVFRNLVRFCLDRGVAMRIPWRMKPRRHGTKWSRRLREIALDWVNDYNYLRWGRAIRCNKSFGSVFDLGRVPEVLGGREYETIIAAATSEPFELMVHPSGNADEMGQLTRIGRISQAEGEFLKTGELKDIICSYGYQFSTYRDVN
jgi:chitin disaccharide deacetylase